MGLLLSGRSGLGQDPKLVEAKTANRRICIISPSAYPLLKADPVIASAGGAEAQLKTLGLGLAQKGYDIHYVVRDYGQPQTEVISGVTAHKSPFRYLEGKHHFLPLDWLALFGRLSNLKADCHLLKVPKELLLPIGLFCRLYKKSLVFIGQSDKDTDIGLLYSIQNKAVVSLYRMGLRFVDLAIAQNSAQMEGFERLGIACRPIGNMVTLPWNGSRAAKEGYILWVGNSTPNKQPHLFLEIASRLPEYRFRMILAPSAQNRDLRRYADASSVLPNFEYIGFVPFNEIEKYYEGASLLVATSLREGFPNTFLQAWQCGTPVVSLGVDPDEVIGRYSLGRRVGNVDEICGAVKELMEDDDLREKMGARAVEYVREHHSAEVIIRQYEEVLDSLDRERRK